MLLLLAALSAAPAFAQCAMCYTSAAAASKKGQRAITNGVLMLLLPAGSMMAGLVVVGLRYSRRRDKENELKLD
jgi:hypothetical protein